MVPIHTIRLVIVGCWWTSIRFFFFCFDYCYCLLSLIESVVCYHYYHWHFTFFFALRLICGWYWIACTTHYNLPTSTTTHPSSLLPQLLLFVDDPSLTNTGTWPQARTSGATLEITTRQTIMKSSMKAKERQKTYSRKAANNLSFVCCLSDWNYLSTVVHGNKIQHEA